MQPMTSLPNSTFLVVNWYMRNQVGFGDLEMLVLLDLVPSWASCSRKSDHNSANDSFRLPLSGKNSAVNAGVLGVRCQGEMGVLKLGLDAPGRAKPACSLCSKTVRWFDVSARSNYLPSVQSSKAEMICNI